MEKENWLKTILQSALNEMNTWPKEEQIYYQSKNLTRSTDPIVIRSLHPGDHFSREITPSILSNANASLLGE